MLPEERRAQLDQIVQKMIQNKEPDSNIHFVVDDFKKKYAQGTEVAQPASEHLAEATQDSSPSFLSRVGTDLSKRVQNVQEAGVAQYSGQNKNPISGQLQTVGNIAGGITDVVGEVAKSAFKSLPQETQDATKSAGLALLSTNIGKKAIQTLQMGKQYYDIFAQEHPEEAKNLEAVLNIASLLPIGKTAQAGVKGTELALDATKGALTNGLDVTKTALQSAKNAVIKPTTLLDDALEITKPVFDKKASISAFEKAGQKGGVTGTGKMGTYKVAPDARSLEIADSVKNIVSKKNGPIDNIVNLNQEISRVSEQEITPFLKQNPAAFNLKTLNAYIRGNTEIPNFIKADPVLQKTYDLTRESMLEVANKYPKTTEGLWNARKEFDAIAEKQVGKLDPSSGQANAARQAVLDTRRAVNDFIAESTPGGDVNFKAKLKTLSNYYEARGNIAETNYKLLDKNALQRWIKQNPGKAKILKTGGGLIVGGGVVTTGAALLGN